MFKKLLCYLVCLAALVTLAGCDFTRGSVIVEKNDNKSKYSAELTFLSFKADAESLQVFESVLRRFMDDNNDINVFYEGIKAPMYFEALEKRENTHHLDDLLMLNHDYVLSLSEKGRLVDLNGLDGIERFTESALEQVRDSEGHIYCLPLAVTFYSLYVNETLLAENGLDVPTNLAEFSEACDYFADKGVVPIIANNYNALPTIVAAKSLYDVYQCDSEEYREYIDKFNSGELSLAEKYREGLDFVEEMIQRGWIDTEEVKATKQTSDDLDIFAKGERPFMITGSWATVRVRNREPDFEYNVYPYPILDDGSVLTVEYNTMLSINAGSKYPEAARKLGEFIISPDVIHDYCECQTVYSPLDDDFVPGEKTISPLAECYTEKRYVLNSDYNLRLPLFYTLQDVMLKMLDGMSAEEAQAEIHKRFYESPARTAE